MPYRGKVTTGGDVIAELYEISARYAVIGRLDYHVSEPSDIYKSAVAWLYIEAATSLVDGIMDNDAATPGQMRNALLDLATKAVAWAREIRDKCQ